MDAAAGHPPYRRIGTILVERGLITEHQLAHGLAEQSDSGRPLGEICVERFGLDRLSLADALAEQWEEMQRASAAAQAAETMANHDAVTHAAEAEEADLSAEDELRALLEEAEAARAELATKTDELTWRLAALEKLVVGVSDALAELRPGGTTADTPDHDGENGTAPPAPAKRARSSRRSSARRAASA